MKKNFTYLVGLAICLFSFTNLQAQECFPAGPVAVSGTADANMGSSFSFTDVPVGTVIELITANANDVFTIELCGTNADGWADGDHDSSCHILDANDATANYLLNIEDGCTNGAGPNFWGPDTGSWGATAMGTTYLYITEWNAAGNANCEVTSGQMYTVNITVSAPGNCEAGVVTADAAQSVCPTQQFDMTTDGTQSADGGFQLGIDNTNTGGTGGTGAAIRLININADAFPLMYDNDLNGILAANNLPPLAGTWEMKIYAIDATDADCDSTDIVTVTFLEAADPACDGVSVDDLAEVTSWSITPNPSNGPVRVALELNATYNEVSVEIFDITGKMVASEIANNVNAVNHDFDFTNLANGMYLAKIGIDGNYTTEKIMISK